MRHYQDNKSPPHYFTLQIKQSPCIAKHKVITDNCNRTKRMYWHATVRLVNDSKKGRSYRCKYNVEIRNSAQNDRHRPWCTLRDDGATDAQQLQWRRDPA